MSAQIKRFASCANYGYPGLMGWIGGIYEKRKNPPLLFANLLNPFPIFAQICAGMPANARGTCCTPAARKATRHHVPQTLERRPCARRQPNKLNGL